jgi:hypothetical protein
MHREVRQLYGWDPLPGHLTDKLYADAQTVFSGFRTQGPGLPRTQRGGVRHVSVQDASGFTHMHTRFFRVQTSGDRFPRPGLRVQTYDASRFNMLDSPTL